MGHGDAVDDKHSFSSIDVQSIKENYPDIRGRDMDMCLESQR